MSAGLEVAFEDVLTAKGDVLILKFADAHRGADALVAQAIGADFSQPPGRHAFFDTRGKIGAAEVLVLGVGPLRSFEYSQISSFADAALKIVARERPMARTALITVHGPGYGLDELASIDSLLRGITTARSTGAALGVRIVERDKRRAEKIATLLSQSTTELDFTRERAQQISHNDTFSRRLFTAMPFSNPYRDHWELAIQPAGHECGFVCERLDHEQFFGDIVSEIRNRIEKSRAVLGLLDEFNANVFLEVGYAWGVGKPTLLMLREGVEAPFDVRGHNIIRYGRLGELKERLTIVISDLANHGRI